MPPGAAQTPDERRAALDRKLDDSLGTFDAELRKEQERVAKERDARQAGGDASATSDAGASTASTARAAGTGTAAAADAAGATGTDSSGTTSTEGPDKDSDTNGDSSKRGRAGKGRSDGQRSRAGDLKSDKSVSTAAGGAAGNGATAREIPDGSDDDIVARRLRKAAEQETDPELKDKLWKEYIDYKNNAGK